MLHTMVGQLLLNIQFDSSISRQLPQKSEPVKAHLSLLQDFWRQPNMDLLYLRVIAKVIVLGVNNSAFQQAALLYLILQLT